MISTRIAVDKLEGLLGTADLTEWERKFVADMVARRDSARLIGISERQIDVLTRLHDKHFA